MSQLTEIFEGWYKYLKMEKLSPDERRIAELRLQSCGNCHLAEEHWIRMVVGFFTEMVTGKRKKVRERRRNGFRCGVCHCPLIPHALSPATECPLPEYKGTLYADKKRWGMVRFENGILVTGEEIYITEPTSGFAGQKPAPHSDGNL